MDTRPDASSVPGEQPLRQTTSLCARCKLTLPATLWRTEDGRVEMRKRCEVHGPQRVTIAADADWWERMMAFEPALTAPRQVMNEVRQGCPYDCGACSRHEQAVQLPIVPITSACNLSCPICYTHTRNDDAWHMSTDEMRSVLTHLRTMAPERRTINITGGEPTCHPQLAEIVELCREEGIGNVTISTHGLGLLADDALLQRLAAAGAQIVLSFDSFEGQVNRAMLGGDYGRGKMRVIDRLRQLDMGLTLLPVVARGYNDHELGDFVALALEEDFVRSLEIHTMTFTGQYGAGFDRQGRYTTWEVLRDLEAQTEGRLQIDDFVPSPSAHPLCYLICYVLRLSDGRWLPFSRFMTPHDVRRLMAGRLYLEPDAQTEQVLLDVINRLWAGELGCPDADDVLESLNALVRSLFAPEVDLAERRRRGERATKAIYVHAHMDEETFDTDRIRQCCVGIVEPDGRNIPSCAYNVLYRERDPRFQTQPARPLHALGPGRIDPG